eukprot:gb/GEZN01006248.1/.p1 GENE.gb/GEZN01006248.1/~~gb/GEZN01006248.1/.p1  ORF type:complete len:301 (-),score=42.98 gb/GEZN01006248.1/:652-1554(-)
MSAVGFEPVPSPMDSLQKSRFVDGLTAVQRTKDITEAVAEYDKVSKEKRDMMEALAHKRSNVENDKKLRDERKRAWDANVDDQDLKNNYEGARKDVEDMETEIRVGALALEGKGEEENNVRQQVLGLYKQMGLRGGMFRGTTFPHNIAMNASVGNIGANVYTFWAWGVYGTKENVQRTGQALGWDVTEEEARNLVDSLESGLVTLHLPDVLEATWAMGVGGDLSSGQTHCESAVEDMDQVLQLLGGETALDMVGRELMGEKQYGAWKGAFRVLRKAIREKKSGWFFMKGRRLWKLSSMRP